MGHDPIEAAMELLLDNSVSRRVQKFGRRSAPVLQYSILLLVCLLSFFIRLFAVIRFESVIHEFDPYFNLRTSRFLARHGFYEFWNWFDEGSWYPLGRVIGQTLYPGLMSTAAMFHFLVNSIGLVIDIKDICVFLAPLFSGFSAMAAFLFTREVTGPGAGLFAAAFMGIVPSYLSRSVAGSYDNEGVAIFALLFAFYMFIRAINKGTVWNALLASLAYFYMVASWGGYVFITNIVAIYMVLLLMLKRLTYRHYVVYAVFYAIGTLLCLNIPFVNFNAVNSSEHMASHGVFLVLTAYVLSLHFKKFLTDDQMKTLIRATVIFTGLSCLLLFTFLSLTGRSRWSGRSMTLLDPSYAAKYIPIIASVSEHQPTTWASYILDLHVLIVLMPVGLFVCFRLVKDGHLFIGLYGILSVYFSAVMVRLMLVLAPAAACLSGIGLAHVVSSYASILRGPLWPPTCGSLIQLPKSTSGVRPERSGSISSVKVTRSKSVSSDVSVTAPIRSSVSRYAALAVLAILCYICGQYIVHCTWTSSLAYSHPSIVLAHKTQDGTRVLQDDFREAYYWLRQNTDESAKIMSWWDYGYQITAMSNRTVLVDNNTWNNTHIATVGLAFTSNEDDAYPIIQQLDVDYVLVVFGGLARYQSDDINKFLWIIRIVSGVYPRVRERDYYGSRGYYTVDSTASEVMLNSLMYKLSYYRLNQANGGQDYTRQVEIGRKKFSLKHFDEAFTTKNWIVRIYSVRKAANRGVKVRSRQKG